MIDSEAENTAGAPRSDGPCLAVAATESPGRGEWIISRYDDVRAVLSDERFAVPEVEQMGPPGTIAWFRASVSRFVNGAEHQMRRARVVEAVALLEPAALRSSAYKRTLATLSAAGRSGHRVDVMSRVARRVPMATMAGPLGFDDAEVAAEAAISMAAGYPLESNPSTGPAADAATARLVDMLAPAQMPVIIARISLMMQACDATAGLIGTSLHFLQDATAEARGSWSTTALLSEASRHRPVLRASLRSAHAAVEFSGRQISAGDTVVCDIDAANRDPAIFEQPDRFDPARTQHASLTFGYGYRPCPGQPHALMLAAGVVDAVRQSCTFVPGTAVVYEPSAPLRIPSRLDVVLR